MKTVTYIGIVLVVLMALTAAPALAGQTTVVKVRATTAIPANTPVTNTCVTPNQSLLLNGNIKLFAHVALHKDGKFTGGLEARPDGVTATDPVSGTVYNGRGVAVTNLKGQATAFPVTIASLPIKFNLVGQTKAHKNIVLHGTVTLTNVVIQASGITTDPINPAAIVFRCSGS